MNKDKPWAERTPEEVDQVIRETIASVNKLAELLPEHYRKIMWDWLTTEAREFFEKMRENKK